jgi:hypothetical protein
MVVGLDVIKRGVLPKGGHLIEVPGVSPEMGELDEPVPVDPKGAVVGRVEAGQGYPEPDGKPNRKYSRPYRDLPPQL